jgi:hypothetical protein
LESAAVALGLLLVALPAASLVAVVAALSHATGLPRNAPPQVSRTVAALGAAFLFVPLVVLLELLAPGVAATRPGGPTDARWIVAGSAYFAIVTIPIVLGRTWIRRISPTRAIARLTTSAGLAIAVEFVLVDAICRLLLGSGI